VYLSRPPISPKVSADGQLTSKPTVKLHRGVGNVTTVMAVDNALRHPVTQRFQKRWQNEQSSDFSIKDELVVDAGE
jgi:hypothetical protein